MSKRITKDMVRKGDNMESIIIVFGIVWGFIGILIACMIENKYDTKVFVPPIIGTSIAIIGSFITAMIINNFCN